MTKAEPQKVCEPPTNLPKFVTGFDGFVDTILQAVSSRQGPDKFIAVANAKEFGRIPTAAGIGRKSNIEFFIRRRKLGGNGPIFAIYPLSTLNSRHRAAENLKGAVQLDCVVIHTHDRAIDPDDDATDDLCIEAVSHPIIYTGGGDHFDSGFRLGRLNGASLHDSLVFPIEVARNYIRSGESPTKDVLSLNFTSPFNHAGGRGESL
jgi:hypothetical protein